MILSVLLDVCLAVLAYRFVARALSYVRVESDGVHVRNFPRHDTTIPLGEVDRFEAEGPPGAKANVTLLRRGGAPVSLTALGRFRRPGIVTELNNRLVEMSALRTAPQVVSDDRSTAPVGLQYPQPGPGWAVVAHLGFFVFALIVPFLVMATKGRQDARIRREAVEAFNFQATFGLLWALLIAAFVVSQVLGLALWLVPVAIVLAVAAVVAVINAAVRAGRGQESHYPATIRFIKS